MTTLRRVATMFAVAFVVAGGEFAAAQCVITCPSNVTKANDTNQCGGVTNYPAPSFTAACGSATCSPASGSFFPRGTTSITCSTSAGPTCSFSVTILDVQPPTVTCPANVVRRTTGPSLVVTYPPPIASDNCPGVTVSCTLPSGSSFPLGTNPTHCNAIDAVSNANACTFQVRVVSKERIIDFDGDIKTDLTAYAPASGIWYVRSSMTGTVTATGFGGSGYTTVPGDYDGDGKTDLAVYHAASGLWFIRSSSTGTDSSSGFGGSGYAPVRVDFDADGKTDLALFNEAAGVWLIKNSSNGAVSSIGYGGTGYVAVPGDYERDASTNVAVFHPPSGLWFIRSAAGATSTVGFGASGYQPVRGDWDADGRSDLALYHASSGIWFVRRSSDSVVTTTGFGGPGYLPTPEDYDGDGVTDLAVYHPPSGLWFVKPSLAGGTTSTGFGGPGYDAVN